MKQCTIIFVVVILILPFSLIFSQTVCEDDALTVARSWLNTVIANKENWGGAETAHINSIEPFEDQGKKLGYFCQVHPTGFIITSIRKEFAPVKCYSETTTLDILSEEGFAGYLKFKMSDLINTVEETYGKIDSLSPDALSKLLEIDYRDSWENLESGRSMLNFTGGEILLKSSWHQNPPYNNQCPYNGCNNSNGKTLVGCVATAGAQIMRYWCWPPYGESAPYDNPYDWVNMPDTIGVISPLPQQAAVSELCFEAGDAAGMNYGCNNSWAYMANNPVGTDMLDAFENEFRFDTNADFMIRGAHTATEWFNIIQTNINSNRPLQYAIQTSWLGGHSMVCDGWQENGSQRFYHMNYGWDNSYTAWYALDALAFSVTYVTEMMIRLLKPVNSIGGWISGNYYYLLSFPFRYFDQDASGHNATFYPGQKIQFLPNIKVVCSNSTGAIDFVGYPGQGNSLLFTRGDKSKGIRIMSGRLRLTNQGGIRFQ